MSHLGRWLSALVDGELDDIERDLVLNHLAGCSGCRHEVNAMRTLKRRLTALGTTLGETSADAVAGRLMDLARTGLDPAAGAWPAPVQALAPAPRGRHRAWPSYQARPGWKLAAAATGAALSAIGVIAFMLGSAGPQPMAPKIIPSVDAYWFQHDYDTGQAPAARPVPPLGGPGLAGGAAGGAGSAGAGQAHSASTSQGSHRRVAAPTSAPGAVPALTPAATVPPPGSLPFAQHLVRYAP